METINVTVEDVGGAEKGNWWRYTSGWAMTSIREVDAWSLIPKEAQRVRVLSVPPAIVTRWAAGQTNPARGCTKSLTAARHIGNGRPFTKASLPHLLTNATHSWKALS